MSHYFQDEIFISAYIICGIIFFVFLLHYAWIMDERRFHGGWFDRKQVESKCLSRRDLFLSQSNHVMKRTKRSKG